MTPALWTLLAASAFAFLLAVQMRFLVSHALRKALAAKFGGEFSDARWRAAVAKAGWKKPAENADAAFLNATYPLPVSHMRLARLVSMLAPLAIVAAAAALRQHYGTV